MIEMIPDYEFEIEDLIAASTFGEELSSLDYYLVSVENVGYLQKTGRMVEIVDGLLSRSPAAN